MDNSFANMIASIKPAAPLATTKTSALDINLFYGN